MQEAWIVIWRDGGAIESVEVWENTEIAAEACYDRLISELADKFGVQEEPLLRLFPTLLEMSDPNEDVTVDIEGRAVSRADVLTEIVWVEKGRVRQR